MLCWLLYRHHHIGKLHTNTLVMIRRDESPARRVFVEVAHEKIIFKVVELNGLDRDSEIGAEFNQPIPRSMD